MSDALTGTYKKIVLDTKDKKLIDGYSYYELLNTHYVIRKLQIELVWN